MRAPAHGAGSGVEMDMSRRAPPVHSDGDHLERDVEMGDVRDRASEPVD